MEKIIKIIDELNLILKNKREVNIYNDFLIIDKCNNLYFETLLYLSNLENMNLNVISSMKLHYIYKDRIEKIFNVQNKLPWELGLLIENEGLNNVINKIVE
jgi:hypothetical protein